MYAKMERNERHEENENVSEPRVFRQIESETKLLADRPSTQSRCQMEIAAIATARLALVLYSSTCRMLQRAIHGLTQPHLLDARRVWRGTVDAITSLRCARIRSQTRLATKHL